MDQNGQELSQPHNRSCGYRAANKLMWIGGVEAVFQPEGHGYESTPAGQPPHLSAFRWK